LPWEELSASVAFRNQPCGPHEPRIPQYNFLFVQQRPDPVAGKRLELVALLERNALRKGGLHDGLPQRMFRTFFRGARKEQELFLAHAVLDDIRNGRFAAGERAGLVEDDGIDLLGTLKAFSVLTGCPIPLPCRCRP
jgi:hypothetical protein